jgi:hypothetical protein
MEEVYNRSLPSWCQSTHPDARMSIRTPIPRKSYNEPQYMLKEKATIPAKSYDELKSILKEKATEEDYI